MNQHTVALTRVFDAPRSRVFECWTRAEHLQHWFGPKGFTIHSCQTDPRPGGMFKLCMRAPDGKDYWVRGQFKEMDFPKHLVITCAADDDQGVERQDDGRSERSCTRTERRGGRDAQGDGPGLGADRRAPRRTSEEMTMLKWSLAALAAVVVIFLIVVAMQPSEFKVERSATLRAPAPAAFAQVNDFHAWQAWSPWEKIDPALKRQYEGPKAGTGAVYAWQGNKDVGEGRMTITDSRPGELVRIKLEFFQPFAAVNDTLFTFKPSGDSTAVTWTMSGRNNFISKAMCLFIDMDKMVGGMFDQGLAQMKSTVERKP